MAQQPGGGKLRKPDKRSATAKNKGKAKKETGKVKKSARPKTPRSRKPAGMSLEEWQIALRREFGVVQNFRMKNIGNEPIFSEFIIDNPQTGGRYRVAIRGQTPGDNYCSCPDYSVNTLGTCKHIEFTLNRLRKKRGAKNAFKNGFKPAYSEVYLRYGGTREVVFKPGTECPARFSRLASQYFDSDGVLKANAFSQFDTFIKKVGRNGHELRCYEDAIQFIARVRDQERHEKAIDDAFKKGPDSDAFDKMLDTALYPYQRAGALFAARAGRAIIADDMGLGKTVQAIASCEILARLAGMERVLIVCPTSLKHQWKDEIEKFSARTAEVVEGLQARRQMRYLSESFYKIANYDVIHRDREFIDKWAPDLIILDEAQRIKNWKTRTAQSVKKLESQYAFVLTGTPLENRLEELHSIVEFVDRFHMGPRFRFLDEHQITDEEEGTGRVIGYKNLSKITETLSTILIRRSKKEVLRQLPERLEKKYFVEMTREQMKHHEENHDIVKRIVHKWRRYKFLSETDQRRLMIALQYMRMSCNSTYLLDERTDFGVKADELMKLLHEIFEEPEAKVVVFSQWLRTHELIIRRIDNGNWKHVYFHGGVPGPKRKGLIKQFREDPACRLFLSTDAGGVGLNLQSASAVAIMDQPWNPAVLEQRIGRVHRLGQRRPVRVIHFIAQGTIEHGMLSLLDFKKSLFAGVLDGGKDEVFLGGTRLKHFMDSVEKATDSIPAAMPVQEKPTGDLDEEVEADDFMEEIGKVAAQDKKPAEQAWVDAANAGLAFLDKLGQALSPEKEPPAESPQTIASTIIERDQAGRPYLKLPVPKPETLRKVADLLYEFAGKK